MANRIDRAGIFRAKALQWAVRASQDNPGVRVTVHYRILGEWQRDADGQPVYVDWADYAETDAYGDHVVITKAAKINEPQIRSLREAFGWDGNLEAINGAPEKSICTVTVKPNTYNGETTYRVEWVNDEGFTGGGLSGEADAKTVKDIQSKYGSLLAGAAGAGRPAASLSGTKPAPPPRRTPEGIVPLGEGEFVSLESEKTPFD